MGVIHGSPFRPSGCVLRYLRQTVSAVDRATTRRFISWQAEPERGRRWNRSCTRRVYPPHFLYVCRQARRHYGSHVAEHIIVMVLRQGCHRVGVRELLAVVVQDELGCSAGAQNHVHERRGLDFQSLSPAQPCPQVGAAVLDHLQGP